MGKPVSIEAHRFIRRMHGASQPILIQADDDQYYVAKFPVNMQGPLVTVNEVLGSEAYRSAGLPVPDWRLVHISDKFLNRNRDCWFRFKGQSLRPCAGVCFGSRFVDAVPGSAPGSVYDLLSDRMYRDVHNRGDFWIAWALDVLLLQCDSRQAVFLQGRTQTWEACFIDFGCTWPNGCTGNEIQRSMACRFFDPKIYPEAKLEMADRIYRALHLIRPDRVEDAFSGLPFGWKLDGALEHYNRILNRMTNPARLEEAAATIVASTFYREKSYLGTLPKHWNRWPQSVSAQVSAT